MSNPPCKLSRLLARALSVLMLGLALQGARAQDESTEPAIRPRDAQAEARLRAVLAEPLPSAAKDAELQAQLQQKSKAADELGELPALLAVYRLWLAVQPATAPMNNMANALMQSGLSAESLRIRQQAIERDPPGPKREFIRRNYATDLFDMGRTAQARQVLAQVKQNVAELGATKQKSVAAIYLLRIQAGSSELQSRIEERQGKLAAALAAAGESEKYARLALESARKLSSGARANETKMAAATLAQALMRQEAVLRSANRFDEAEQVLRELLRLSQDTELPPRYIGHVYAAAGALRQDAREFAAAEGNFRKADAVYDRLGYEVHTPFRTQVAGQLIAALAGQRRWPEAVAELDKLEKLPTAGDARRAQFLLQPYLRGYAYLASGIRTARAYALLKGRAQELAQRYPPHHFLLAEARGLQGVAAARLDDPVLQAQALPLLQQSVRDYMLAENIVQEARGLRKDVRELVFASYLEVLFNTPGAQTADGLAPADWVRGGVVQEALADAAARSAASDPALAELVRQDQDARNEINALQKFLAGDTGAAEAAAGSAAPTLTPEVIAEVRSRIAELYAAQGTRRAEMKSRFPGFDRLLRPAPPSLQDLQRELGADEALVLLLPTADAVYTWAVTRGGGPTAAARVALPQAQLDLLVQGTRATLDLGAMTGRLKPFDTAGAAEIYQRLLAPLQAALAGRTQLIVAAGGSLGQIPFGVLLTQPTRSADANAPWLIKQAAITQVPSLSAWIAARTFAKAASAPDALAAWGDPRFSSAAGAATPAVASSAVRQVLLTRLSASRDLDKPEDRTTLRYADIPALPETRDELIAIADALGADRQRDLRLGAAATKASVLQANASGELAKKRVLVFATHGLMARDLPNLGQPALALAASGDDGSDPLGALLMLDEVLGLKLNADWVVLSACNTAASDGKAEEALSGLARGFFYAGSRSLLVTHWAVESQSAKRLTTATFDYYTRHPDAGKAESLRQAMLGVMREPAYTHPAYWAPYALVGDGRR